MKRLPIKTEGIITGLVKSHLFRNEVHGDVPGSVLIGWGTAQGEQYWGGMLKKRIPPWFPCVSYQAGEKEICRIMGEGTWKDTWKTGQKVVVIYDSKNPHISFIEGDTNDLGLRFLNNSDSVWKFLNHCKYQHRFLEKPYRYNFEETLS